MEGIAGLTLNSLPRSTPEELTAAAGQYSTDPGETEMKAREQVPVIDMAGADGPDRQKICEEIARACETWGFFQLINHGIDESKCARAKEVCLSFFRLPYEEKLKNAVTVGEMDGYHSRRLGLESKLTHSVDHFYLTLWPPQRRQLEKWPKHPPVYQEVMLDYAEDIRSLQEKLLEMLSESLGVGRSTLGLQHTRGSNILPTQSMRINYYTPEQTDDSKVSLDPHSDPGSITVLLQGNVPGLQVKNNDEWVGVEPIPNAFVVNVGDQLEILSNGRFKSVEHRGIGHKTTERLSLATFYGPNMESDIGPLEELVSDAQPALYKSNKFKDYMEIFVKYGLNGKQYVRAASITD